MNSGTALPMHYSGTLLFCPPPRDALERPSCSRARRWIRVILMLLVPTLIAFVATLVAGFIVMARMDAENYPSMAAFHQAQLNAGAAVALVVLVILAVLKLAAFVFMAPQVSYRRRDWLLLLVPAYGVLVYLTVLWRFADRSARDWPIRVDEIPADWFVSVPSHVA